MSRLTDTRHRDVADTSLRRFDEVDWIGAAFAVGRDILLPWAMAESYTAFASTTTGAARADGPIAFATRRPRVTAARLAAN